MHVKFFSQKLCTLLVLNNQIGPIGWREEARGALLACRAALIRTNRTQHTSPSSSLSPSRVSASPPAHVQARAVRGGGGGGGAARHVRRRHGRPIDN